MKIWINGKLTDLNRKASATIREQPGYRTHAQMALGHTTAGGLRLFLSIGGVWKDASLRDIPVARLPGLLIHDYSGKGI